MGTKFASYTLKLASLHEYYQRLLHGSQPIPSGVDMTNTLKYFIQTLLSLLKDVEKSPYEMLRYQKLDMERIGLYPNLDYKQLYNAISQLIDVIPSIHIGVQGFGQSLLQCLACLLPFLDHDLIDSLPYLTASTVAVLPEELHQEVINYLCFYILPFTIGRETEDGIENYASQSISAVVMMIFEYSTNSAHHCQLMECLMTLKSRVITDILCVIAYGTTSAKAAATKLLFHYWPNFNPNIFDRKSVHTKLSNDFSAFVCQRDDCPNAGNAEATKVCYSHSISITYATDSPPPLYLCIECANEIHRENPNQMFYDILHPMQQVSLNCENKNCRANDKLAVSVCFSTECVSYNSNHPIRYCQQCHNIRHNNRRGGDHIFHTSLSHVSQMDPQTQTYMVQAIVSLLKEAEPVALDVDSDHQAINTSKGTMAFVTSNRIRNKDSVSSEERQLLGRYGIWLLLGLCTPDDEIPVEILGRLLSMLFHWFFITAYSFDGQAESTLEKLKTEYISVWLSKVMKKYYDVFVSCLLPHPIDYVRVGGHWDTLASRTSHLKDGLSRLFCLVPYEIITPEIWNHVMPHWMEAIVHDVPIHELQELKMTLCKILDPDLSPLGFDASRMYNFVAKRFNNTNAKVQEQALNWLQTLTLLGITIPLPQLFSMFSEGILDSKKVDSTNLSVAENRLNGISNSENTIICRIDDYVSDKSTLLSDDDIPVPRHNEFTSDEELHLTCCILMLDILLKQMELQSIDKHTGVNSWICRDACHLLKSTNIASWITQHICNNINDCSFCESAVIWYQLCLQLLSYTAPEKLALPPDTTSDEMIEDSERKSPLEASKKNESKPDVVINMPIPELHSVGGVLVHMPHFFEQIMTATVETVSEQLDLATVMPTEKIISAMARAVTISDTDVATATVNVDKPNLIGENNHLLVDDKDDMENFWHTSMGKFRFCLTELPEQLQFVHKLFVELVVVKSPDIVCYMLECLNRMCLYGDILSVAAKDHQGFFIWCQENLIIRNLWELLNAEHSHIAQMAVPLLLHCITLTCGIDTFWRIVQDEFQSPVWQQRFIAVERATLIARFMDSTPLKNSTSLQTSLANIFCYLINSMDDNNVYVAQKATLYLGTIHDIAVKALLTCMETQFDLVIIDRPIILQTLYQLHNCLCDRRILTWEFFLNRFDTLFIEAQINLERIGEINYFRDLRNTDVNNELFIKKLETAHEAISQFDGTEKILKTLSASFGEKWPYKRTMSAPSFVLPKHETRQDKEKIYNRQYSAPILKRKSSRFGLGQLIGYTLPNNSITDVHVPSFSVLEDSNYPSFTHKVIDLEESDKETIHLLVFLLMQFLSRSDQAYPSDEKLILKTQGIVLRHLYLLLGYNYVDKHFYMAPHKLRYSAAFSVFITNLPQLLDQNHTMGMFMIQPILTILQNCACPPQKSFVVDSCSPTYSLWCLESQCRRSWLMALLVILYKYEYKQQQWFNSLQILIKIVLNTLERQYHKCKHIPPTVVMSSVPLRSRDVSQPSLGLEHEIISSTLDEIERNSPTSRIFNANSRISDMKQTAEDIIEKHYYKTSSYSLNGEETESELAAIPESPRSDATLQESSSNSLEEIKADQKIQRKNMKIKLKNDQIQQSILPNNIKLNHLSDINNSKQESSTSKKPVTCPNLFGKDYSGKQYYEDDNEIRRSLVNINVSSKSFNNKRRSNKVTYPAACISDTTEICANIKEDIETLPTIALTPFVLSEVASSNMISEKFSSITCSPSLSSTSISNHSKTSHLNNINLPFTVPAPERLLPVGSTSRYNAQTHYEASIFENCFKTSKLQIPFFERLLPIGLQKDRLHDVHDSNKFKPTDTIHVATSSAQDNLTNNNHCSNREEVLSCSVQSIASAIINPKENQLKSSKKLIKQIALESPPFFFKHESNFHDISEFSDKAKKRNINQNIKDFNMESCGTERYDISSRKIQMGYGPFKIQENDYLSEQNHHADSNLKQSIFRISDECNYTRCPDCGILKEEYTDEELGLCIIILSTFIHREPTLAAPLLPGILNTVSNVSLNVIYPWQNELSIHLPGGATSVAHQFLRCVLHQMAPNGIFSQIFQTNIRGIIDTEICSFEFGTFCTRFFKSIVHALIDFNELNPIAPLQILIESLNVKKSLPTDFLAIILHNIACYLDCLPLEAGLGPGVTTWSGLITQLEALFRRLVLLLSTIENIKPILKIMTCVLKIPGVQQSKSLLDLFSKVLSYAIQNCVITYSLLLELCLLCYRNFTKDRDKHYLSRTIVFELIQAIKFKTTLPDTNFILLLQFVLQDAGGLLLSTIKYKKTFHNMTPVYHTNASDLLKNQITDIIDFLMDVHTSSKIKSYTIGLQCGFNEDTLSGILKCGLAQYLSLEITKGNNRENRAITRHLPWLYAAPSLVQQGTREYLECVNHVRLLCWILLGSLSHSLGAVRSNLLQAHGLPLLVAQPIPQEASCHIADHVQVILSSFPDQYKSSSLNMASLFHVFNLCQLWTLYLEEYSKNNNYNTEPHNITVNILLEFWGKITPYVLQLISHSKVFADIVNLHFLSLLESLLDSGCIILSKLLPIWNSIIISHHIQIPAHLNLRLQHFRRLSLNIETDDYSFNKQESGIFLLQWLRRLQFKMGQIELQSSSTTQFYAL
ncbi:protein unc-79 homolog isoform X4 [Nasonia vitripennis]|uniref:Uncharacterized protein n=2 Tax=Nasonia vitripennis TaxID=7425 RepID=A0A7M7T7E2_NASVI|nr:protein unc-79 homolog isoform X4 [Nasonia vitripennis]